MSKKILIAALTACMVLTISGCGNSKKSEPEQTETQQVASTEQVAETESAAQADNAGKDLPDGDYQDTGVGTMYLATAGGTSENGNIPVIFVADESLIQIELDTSEFDGSKLSYIYIDGTLNNKCQLGDSQLPLDLSGDSLSVGTHTVEVLQYDNDSPDGNLVTYKSASYEIKSK